MRIRKELILIGCLELAREKGYDKITRMQVSEHLDKAPSCINYHFKTIANFRKELLQYAIFQAYLPVIAQAVAAQDPVASEASPELRQLALNQLM